MAAPEGLGDKTPAERSDTVRSVLAVPSRMCRKCPCNPAGILLRLEWLLPWLVVLRPPRSTRVGLLALLPMPDRPVGGGGAGAVSSRFACRSRPGADPDASLRETATPQVRGDRGEDLTGAGWPSCASRRAAAPATATSDLGGAEWP